jgi:hypothetical protein
VKHFFTAIGYRASKSDRFVLKCALIICCLIVSAIGLVALIVYVPLVWNPQAKRDSAKLDLILSTQHIDRVEFISWQRTNSITGNEAQKFIASLHRTNRVGNIDWTKQQVESVRLLSGTNEIWLSLGEDGSWEFGEYGFRIRSQ